MQLLILTIIIVGLCVFGLSINIIFKKDGKFPETEVGHNKEMRKRGIICAKEEELRLWGKKKRQKAGNCGEASCGSCTASCEMKNS